LLLQLVFGALDALLFELLDQREIEAIAQERLDMISLLTHEVRQPINNAQAALEALDTALKGTEEEVNETRGAITRAQGILDGITLSISNAILGVLLIDDEHQIQPRPVDAVEVADLARSDCPAEQRHRIHISSSTDPIFADLDPVLIRLALRNLLDNALKYSQPNSLVQIDIAHDDERLGVSFKVTNQIAAPTVLSDDIFRRRVRANASPVEGSGYGLFLVKKVADAHHGKISFDESDEGRITFDLFIPT
jgi:signal transduction histidine kinase